jgi:hypothetical protein
MLRVLPLAVGVSVVGSLFAVWVRSLLAAFRFNPAIVAALSGAITAAVTSLGEKRAL